MKYAVLTLSSIFSLIPVIVYAQPIIPNRDGTGTIVHQQGNQFNIQGGSRSNNNTNLFHSFREFNLNQGQTANFISQPEIKNILGRINGGSPSIINGLIQITGSNSNLFLMNPAGIIFGNHASLNLPASFHVSTATGIGFSNNQWFQVIGNNDYQNLVDTPNKFIFTNKQNGIIINEGNLNLTTGKSLTLLGSSVINTGKLSTSGGNITMVAVPGENIVKISQAGHLLSLELLPLGNNSLFSEIKALSLPQFLTGNSSDNQANTIKINEFGQIVLGNTDLGINDINQTVINTGKIDVSQSHYGNGGQVNIIGKKVGLIGAEINASGYTHGGRILIGGDWQGQGIIPNALQTYVSQDSIINANSINNGNGGKIIIWSDNQTTFQGNITARGGINGGNGGLVEISGKKELFFNGKVDVSAVNGLSGTVLFDPDNLTLEKFDDQDNLEINPESNTNNIDIQSSVSINQSEETNITKFDQSENTDETSVINTTKNINVSTNQTKKTSKESPQTKQSPNKTVTNAKKLPIEKRIIDPFTPDKSNNVVINSENVNKLDVNQLDISGNVELQANNDLTVNQAIATDKSLKLIAGRSITINADINTSKGNGNIRIFANDTRVDQAKRQAGPAHIMQADNTVLNAGAGNIRIQMGTLGEIGQVQLGNLTTTGLIAIQGAGANINQVSDNSLFKAGKISLETSEQGGIGSLSSPLRIEANNLEAVGGKEGIFLNILSDVTIGDVNDGMVGINTSGGGDINLKANNLNIIEDISATSMGNDAASVTLESSSDIDSRSAQINFQSFNNLDKLSIVANGNIRTGNIKGEENVIIQSLQGVIDTSAGKISISSTQGNLGNISILANDDIKIGNIDVNGDFENFIIKSENGLIDNSVGDIYISSTQGNLGNISILAHDDIRTKDISIINNKDLGNIDIESKQGLIDTSGGEINIESKQGNLGNISILANKHIKTGAIDIKGKTTGNIKIQSTQSFIDSSSGEIYFNLKGDNVGNISILADDYIKTGEINFFSNSKNIKIESKQSFIDTSANKISFNSTKENVGDISILANGDIKTGDISSIDTSIGHVRNLTIQSTQGSINTSLGNIDVSSEVGNGGNVNLTAYGAIVTGDINTRGQQKGGDVNLTTKFGSIDTTLGDINTITLGTGGNVNLTADGKIVTGNINTGGLSIGGDVNLTSQSSSVDTTLGEINTNAILFGRGGNVNLIADKEIMTGDINTQGFSIGGDVNLTSQSSSVDTTLGEINTNAILINNPILGNGINGKVNIKSPLNIRVGKFNTSKNLIIANDGKNLLGSKKPEANIKADADQVNQSSGEIFLEAYNDINIEEPIKSSEISRLELKAGRNINIKADIDTSAGNGNIILLGNMVTEHPELRELGKGAITMLSGTNLNSGSGDILIKLGNAGELGQVGNIILGNLQTTGLVNINANGGNILSADQNSVITSGNLLLETFAQGGIGSVDLPLSIKTNNLEALSGSNGLHLKVLTPVTIGNVSNDFSGINTEQGGEINIYTEGNLTINENISTSSWNSDGGNIVLASQGNIKFDVPSESSQSLSILDSTSTVGSGGDITVKAKGKIYSLNLEKEEANSSSYATEATDKMAGGKITFQAKGDIKINSLVTGNIYENNNNIQGGDILVNSKQGEVTIVNLASPGKLNKAGNVRVKAKKDIKLYNINALSDSQGGNIFINSENGNVQIINIDSYSPLNDAGNIKITAKNNIEINYGINAMGSRQGGNIDIYSSTGDISFRRIDSSGNIQAGNIKLKSQQGKVIEIGNIYIYDSFEDIYYPEPGLFSQSVGGQAGNIDVNAQLEMYISNINTSGNIGGGNINLLSEIGDIIVEKTSSQASTSGQVGEIIAESTSGNIILGELQVANLTIADDGKDNYLDEQNQHNATSDANLFNSKPGLVLLKANNDITIRESIITDSISDLKIQAGRNIKINADIDTSASNGDISLEANYARANPLIRGQGTGNITMANNTKIKSGKGNIELKIGDFGINLDNTSEVNKYVGSITLNNIINSGELLIDANEILRTSPDSLITAGKTRLRGNQIGLLGQPLRVQVNSLDAVVRNEYNDYNGRNIYLEAPYSGLNIDNIKSGEIVITAHDNILANGNISGAEINLESYQGAINTINSELSGKVITIKSPKNIDVGNITAENMLTINSTAGNIDSSTGVINNDTAWGNVEFTALGDIKTGFIFGNNIRLFTQAGSIDTTLGNPTNGIALEINPNEEIVNVISDLNNRGEANITLREKIGEQTSLQLEAEGNIKTNSILSSANNSNINITSKKGNINTDAIISLSPLSNTGNINLNAPFGNINTNHLYNFSNQVSGDINITAGKTFNIGNATINAGGISFEGIGGNVTINAGKDVLLGGDAKRYGIRTEGREGGGDISITATDGKIVIPGDLNSYSKRDQAGHILLSGKNGVTTRNIISDGPLESGNVTINSNSGAIFTNNIITIAPNGESGNINLNTIQRQGNIASADISTIGNISAGKIKILATDGSVQVENITSSATEGTAGGIHIGGNDITTGNQTVNSSEGSGQIENEARNNIKTGDLTVSAEEYALIKQLAGNNIETRNIKVKSQSGDASNQQQAGQNIQTGNISVIAGNNAENVQKAGGNIQTGDINITAGNNALNHQEAGGNITTGNIDITAGNDAINQQNADGNIKTGDINITAGNNAVNEMKAGGLIDTGTINLNAPNIKNSIQGNKAVSTGLINNLQPKYDTPSPAVLNLLAVTRPNNFNSILNTIIPTSPIVVPSIKTFDTNQQPILQTLGKNNQLSQTVHKLDSLTTQTNHNIISNPLNISDLNVINNIIQHQQPSFNHTVNTTITIPTEEPNLDNQQSRKLSPYILTINNTPNIASNSQLLKELESDRNKEFSKYWGKDFADAPINPESIRNILGKIKEQTGTNPAVMYITAYSDSLQIVLYTTSGEPIFKTIPVSRKELLKVVQDFQLNLTHPRERNRKKYLTQAQQLYQWLIKPIEDTLQNDEINTLLFSLDQGLRSLPMAALHDGKQFLVEKYSSSIIPSISLMNTEYEGNKKQPLLAVGISQFNNLPNLPAVPAELKNITSEQTNSQILFNEKVTRNNLIEQQSHYNYHIIHLATHAEFLPGNASNSYIQLWGEQLKPSQIRELGWQNSNLELLVLSACRTALGDPQAELGFAGLAVATGVKSALGSLWYVSDYGTLGLMTEFYANLLTLPIKAEALRQAQLAMLRGEVNIKNGQLFNTRNRGVILPPELAEVNRMDFSHPYYWSGFTIIGNPW